MAPTRRFKLCVVFLLGEDCVFLVLLVRLLQQLTHTGSSARSPTRVPVARRAALGSSRRDRLYHDG